MSHLSFWITLFSLACSIITHGQSKYWVPTEKTSQLSGKTPTFCSEWLQVCSYQLTKNEAKHLGLRPNDVVKSFESTAQQPGANKNVGFAIEQIEGQLLIDKGLTGKGIILPQSHLQGTLRSGNTSGSQ